MGYEMQVIIKQQQRYSIAADNPQDVYGFICLAARTRDDKMQSEKEDLLPWLRIQETQNSWIVPDTNKSTH